MRADRKLSFRGRVPHAPSHNTVALAKTAASHGVPFSKRTRGGSANLRLPFAPPEDWYEPSGTGRGYRVIIAGAGRRLPPRAYARGCSSAPGGVAAGVLAVAGSPAILTDDAQEAEFSLLRHAVGDHSLPLSDREEPDRILPPAPQAEPADRGPDVRRPMGAAARRRLAADLDGRRPSATSISTTS